MNHEIKDDEAPFKMKDGVVTAEQKSPVASSVISNDRLQNIIKVYLIVLGPSRAF